jgi:arylsulfatase A-like enzyme
MDLNRRDFLRAAAGALALATGVRGAARRPNIVVVLADDLGYADVGFQGAADIPTPNLDRLAASGIRCTSGYVSHPFCSPTRAGLMTGRYQQRFGHENNPRYDPHDAVAGLPLAETTLPQTLREAGYVTGHVGKWHLGATPKHHPLKRGFTESFGFLGGGHDYFKSEMSDGAKEYMIPIQRDGKAVEEKEYLTDAFSREACAFVRRHAKDPFFLYLAYNAPHTPQQASGKYLDRFANISDPKRKLCAAMVSAVDDGIGRLTETLRELKLESDTLVFFLSDNGGPLAVNGTRNTPLRGAKGQVFEGGIRVPFVVSWPGQIAKGKKYGQPVISLDIFPTAAAAAGVELKPAVRAKLDGVNLLPHLQSRAATAPHQRLFWRTGGGVSYAVREGRYKLVRQPGGNPQLFDLDTDISESTDLAAAQPELAAKLNASLDEWNKQLIKPLFESPRPAGKK